MKETESTWLNYEVCVVEGIKRLLELARRANSNTS